MTRAVGEGLAEAVPLDGMRGLIAGAMTRSLRETAQFTLHRQIDAAALVELREAFREAARPSVTDLLLAVAARALARHPAVNATLEGETIRRWRSVHLGVAVAVEAGLVVPVIRDADRLSLERLREEAGRLRRAARDGELAMSDIQGGTFTVSNLGGFGIDAFTPIVHTPQVGILGVGRIDGGSLWLSLTLDHRAVDGVPGARFLDDLATGLQDPRGVIEV